ncbi:MAG: hypothetical protein J5594_05725 [Elusimicrobiaceae bacterium]|nr:hypothetical protein [Elusimicrobiaceae bacterium]
MAAKARAIMPSGGRMSRAPIATKLKFGYAQIYFPDLFALRKTYVYIFLKGGPPPSKRI